MKNAAVGFAFILKLLLASMLAVLTPDTATATETDTQRSMVEWLEPAFPSAVKKTEEEKAHAREHGRATPQAELLQPTLDPGLIAFEARTEEDLSGAINGTASDVLPLLVQSWLEGFKKHYPQVDISLSPPFAGSLGMLELIDGNLDFVFVSRELKPSDIESFNDKYGYRPLTVPIVGGTYRHYGFLDAMGVFVHVDNPIERITLEQLDALFSSTRHRGGEPIRTWGQLGLTGDWSDQPVNLYGIRPWNGFEEFFRQRIMSLPGKRGEWRDDINLDKVVFPTVGKISRDPYALGYSGLAYIDAAVKVLPIGESEDGPYYSASYENVASANYVLSRLVYFNTNRDPDQPLNPVMRELLRFILSREGQQLVLDHGVFLPLRAWQAEASRQMLGDQ